MHWYLFPFSILYGAVVGVRNKFFDWGWIESREFDIPIINVGNITVGGTGKTPHVEYLLNLLKEYSVATISRGYKRKTKGFVQVKVDSNARDVGDEPLQIKCKYPKAQVVVDEKRAHAIDKLISDNNSLDVILLDDAYQHRYVKPRLNILLVDYSRRISKDFILPVGRLREPAHNCHRADVVIVTKCPADLNSMSIRLIQKELNLFPYQSLFFSTFIYSNLVPVFNSNPNISDLYNLSILVVTGIANPKPLYTELESKGARISKLAFPDHHEFVKSDIEKIIGGYEDVKAKKKIIVCTEKDAVRLKTSKIVSELLNLPLYYLPIDVEFLNRGERDFKNVVLKCINSVVR